MFDHKPAEAEIEARFWKDLKSAPFVMLGLVGARDGHTQPMTAQFERDHGPLYFFTATDNGVIDRLWNPQVAAWFEGGRNDPKLCLLRLDTEKAELWLGASSIGAAITRLLGRDPKQDYKGKTAEVNLS